MLALVPSPRPARSPAPRMGLWVPSHPELDGLRRRVLRPGRFVPARPGTAPEARRLLGPVGFRPPAAEAPEAPAWERGLRRDVAALKTHLDLVNEAGRAAPEAGGAFWYDLPEALARLGYRRQGHGAFNSDTLARHAERVRALCEGPEAPWRLSGEAAPTASGTPRRLRLSPGPALARWLAKVPADARGLTSALLALPTHGQGNERNRLAVLLAAELAGWARAGARRGAKRLVRPVGALLARAGIATLTELHDAQLRSPNAVKRLRANLAGEGFADEGAFALLRDLGGYGLDVVDEEAFWASGPGWVSRFWEARVGLTLGS